MIKVIKRSELKNIILAELRKSGDPEGITKTIEVAVYAIKDCKLGTVDGQKVLYTTMGSNVYFWMNKEIVSSAERCLENASIINEDELKNDIDYIREMN